MRPWMTLRQAIWQNRQKVFKKNRCRAEFGWADCITEEGRMKMEMKIKTNHNAVEGAH